MIRIGQIRGLLSTVNMLNSLVTPTIRSIALQVGRTTWAIPEESSSSSLTTGTKTRIKVAEEKTTCGDDPALTLHL
jgi:hypothetical protein